MTTPARPRDSAPRAKQTTGVSHIQRAFTDPPTAGGRGILPLVVLMLGLLGTLGVAFSVASSARARVMAEFEAQALDASVLVTDAFEQPLRTLSAIQALYAAGDGLERASFEAFARSLLQDDPAIAMLEWAPRVSGADRRAFERAAIAEGYDDFVIVEPGPAGELEPVMTRSEHYPLLYIVPESPNALGLDLLAEESRRNLVYRTVERDQPVASAPFSLVEDPDDEFSVAVYRTVRDDAGVALGLAIAIVRLEGIMSDPSLQRLTTQGTVEVAIGLSDTDERIVESAGFEQAAGEERSFEYEYGGQPWTVIIRSQTKSGAGPGPWLVLALGVVLSLFGARAATAYARVDALEQKVEDATQIGQYHVVGKIGEGGMGVVYRATHALLQRPTAIKMISGSISETDLKRFEREVRLTARLRHPNSIEVYDYGRTDAGAFYFAMEFLEGMTLRQLVKQHGPVGDGRAMHILNQVLGALTEAHEVGIVHRDLKPENVMLSHRIGWPDFVSVLDFGLAKPMKRPEGEASLTAGDVILGTPHYIAPEQVTGKPLDGRADLYALGCVAFYLLTGTTPFQAKSAVELCIAHVEKPAPKLRDKLGADTNPALEDWVSRAMSKKPEERFDSALHMRRALDDIEPLSPWSDDDAQAWWVERQLAETKAS